MKKRILYLILAGALLVSVAVGATVAYLVASSQPVVNSFTVGSVQITLTESTGTEYKLFPGAMLVKDPVVTVKAGSDTCWLYVKIQRSADFDNFCTFDLADGWLPLEGQPDVYYRTAETSGVDRVYRILKNDRVAVKDTVTEDHLNALTRNPTLDFTAYAVQRQGVSSPADGWQILNP